MTLLKARRSLSTRIAIGLAAGLALGLLVGERTSVLNVVADGYIKLLQMTVLPFVTVSIVGGVGALLGLGEETGVVERQGEPHGDLLHERRVDLLVVLLGVRGHERERAEQR